MRKLSNIYTTTRQLLLHPATSWSQVFRTSHTFRTFLRSYLICIATLLCIIVSAIHLFQRPLLQAFGFGITHFISTLVSIWLAFLLAKEYLCHKLNYREQEVLPLVGYSSAIFIIFYSIGHALGTMFIGQLFILFSFSFLRTLYWGVKQLDNYQEVHQSNIMIILALIIIFIPMIINQILTITFGLSVILV